eukprot:82173-Hanusia_phi.AAC.3
MASTSAHVKRGMASIKRIWARTLAPVPIQLANPCVELENMQNVEAGLSKRSANKVTCVECRVARLHQSNSKRACESAKQKEELKRRIEGKKSLEKEMRKLEFLNFMSEKEINSLLRQLMLIYAMGSENWFIEKTEAAFLEHYVHRMQSLVYLTADSDEEIESIDDDTVMTLGATLRTALESEVKTKKIAVRKYVDLAHGSSEVLTLNQVQHEMQRSLKKI